MATSESTAWRAINIPAIGAYGGGRRGASRSRRANTIRIVNPHKPLVQEFTLSNHDSRPPPAVGISHGGSSPEGDTVLLFYRSRQRRPASHRLKKLEPPTAPTTRSECFSPLHEVLFVLIICSAQMFMLAGLAQAMLPAPLIGLSFPDTSQGSMAWYSAAYSLTSATFVLPSGRFGDLFGDKRAFIIGFAWFGLWSMLAGFAALVQSAGGQGTAYFCFARAMQGVGPALLVPNGQALLGRVYAPGMRKNMVLCLFGASAPFGFVVGGIMSSLVATKAD